MVCLMYVISVCLMYVISVYLMYVTWYVSCMSAQYVSCMSHGMSHVCHMVYLTCRAICSDYVRSLATSTPTDTVHLTWHIIAANSTATVSITVSIVVITPHPNYMTVIVVITPHPRYITVIVVITPHPNLALMDEKSPASTPRPGVRSGVPTGVFCTERS